MDFKPWKKVARGYKLSVFLDGELDRPAADRLREQLVFDQRLKYEMRDYTRLDELVEGAFMVHDQVEVDERVGQIEKALEIDAEPEPVGRQKTQRNIKPALVASLGVLVTAGIALAELRRRGLV